MATGFQMWLLFPCTILLVNIPGVLCDDYNIGGLVAAAAVCILLLTLVIAMIIAGLTWSSWYPQMQWAKGRVKMPRAYWKKREEAKLRLLNGSRSGLASLAAPSESGLPNGNTTSRVRDTGYLNASWVQGWNNAHANAMNDGGYEEMALAMDLGEEEKEEEVRIETTVVDDEALDLGPFRDGDTATTTPAAAPVTMPNGSATAAAVPAGGVVAAGGGAAAAADMSEAEPGDSYVYSTVDRSSKKSSTPRAVADESAVTGEEEGPEATSEKVTSFSKMDPYLVAL